jgi:hypothetical protein
MDLIISHALRFLELLESHGRHTIASEAPFGGPSNGPRWEGGATFESEQHEALINDIIHRQKRKSNVYYSVNEPCKVSKRQGANGKNNIDDIISIRALAFDIDFTSFKRDYDAVLKFIDANLTGELQPSMVINTGGGFHLIYILSEKLNIYIYRPALTEERKESNKISVAKRSEVTALSHDFEHLLRNMFKTSFGEELKVDNMSNIDRVMRLPGTVNYPKAEKIAKGQSEALACIANDYHHKLDIQKLRAAIPMIEKPRQAITKTPFIPLKKSIWTPYLRALACCSFFKEKQLADTNEWYTHNVMLPLIGAIHDPNENSRITIEEATLCFMEAVSGGTRYGTMGRGPGYFMRQWKSHHPELPSRTGGKSLGGLIYMAQQNGMKLPWVGEVQWERDYLRQKEENEKIINISFEDKELFDSK